MSSHPRLAAVEPQVILITSEANELRHSSLSQEPPPPPKMYSPSAASDQTAAWKDRPVGGEPLGLICCQLPCVAPYQNIEMGNHKP